MKLFEMPWPEVDALDRGTVILCPIGALEQHSRHLPFFTDTILCEHVALQVERALPVEVLLLPTQWIGASAHHLGMAGTMTVENDTYLRLLVEPLRCLLNHRFKRVFILNGHGGNEDGFHLALRQLAREYPNALVGGASYWELAADTTAALLDGNRKSVGHACEYETSVMLHVRPDLVRKSEIADDARVASPAGLEHVYRPLDMKRETNHGGSGQATLASAEKGEKILKVVVAACIQAVSAYRKAECPIP